MYIVVRFVMMVCASVTLSLLLMDTDRLLLTLVILFHSFDKYLPLLTPLKLHASSSLHAMQCNNNNNKRPHKKGTRIRRQSNSTPSYRLIDTSRSMDRPTCLWRYQYWMLQFFILLQKQQQQQQFIIFLQHLQ